LDRRAAHDERSPASAASWPTYRTQFVGQAARIQRAPSPRRWAKIDRVWLTRNAVWAGRTAGACTLSAAEAINHSLSGPMLRAAAMPYDVRKDKPYLGYETYDFDVVVGEHGDVFDRYLVRLRSVISRPAFSTSPRRLPTGPITSRTRA